MDCKSSELSESPRVHRAISFRCRDIRAESCRTFGSCHFGYLSVQLNDGHKNDGFLNDGFLNDGFVKNRQIMPVELIRLFVANY